MKKSAPKLIYLVTEDWYFYSHRLPMARAAQQAGYDVAVITNVDRHRKAIEAEGVRVIPLSLERRSLNPFKALGQVKCLTDIYKEKKPDVVHHIAMKPILYGSMAAFAAGVPHVVNAFAGLGFLFTDPGMKARALRTLLDLPLRFLLKRKNSVTLFQNPDDRACLLGRGWGAEDRTVLIKGSGVDTDIYAAQPLLPPDPDFICAFAGRMIGIKGLPTLKEAFSLLAQDAPQVKLWLCGQPDPANPGSWDEARLRAWEAEAPNVVYKGPSAMKDIWPQVHVAVQASYGGEGIPKSLLEAASCGRVIVASDVPGSREVVEDGVNGYLVPARDAPALAVAIKKLSEDISRCQAMGRESRARVEAHFSSAIVTAQTQELYRRFL